MIVSENWLRTLVKFSQGFDQLPALLTQAGLETGPIQSIDSLPKGFITAQIKSTSAHPDADTLRICEVEIGKATTVQVVCGASNARAGLITVYASPGSELPSGTRIEKQAIRGVDSHGMLCSASELNLEEQSGGIIELDEDAALGKSANHPLGLPDQIFEVELTPNRGDCLSMLGVARETAAVTGGTLLSTAPATIKAGDKEKRKVELAAPIGCPRYVGRVIRGLKKDQKSPDWLRERLRRAGIRSIDALVDITNYVMLELGQPMHAFDNECLRGAIQVRMAEPKEKITLLDGQKLTLDDASLLITDDSGPVALAGVKGGAGTMISSNTDAIFLEAAFFDPATTARTARRFNLNTDASHRFERGVDFELPKRAINRATELVLAICGGSAGPIVDATEKKHLPKRAPIQLRSERLKRMLGTSLPAKSVDRVFTRAGYEFSRSGTGWSVLPPSHRFDLSEEHDLVEEVARLVGYDAFPTNWPNVAANSQLAPEAVVALDRARDLLVDRGYFEAITYSFIDSSLQAASSGGRSGIKLKNPIAAHLAEMRLSLLPGLLLALGNNHRRQVRDVRLFETGHIFSGTARKPKEQLNICGVATGSATGARWDQGATEIDFFDVKGDVESLLDLTCRGRQTRFLAASHPAYQDGQCAQVVIDGNAAGYIGRVAHALLNTVDIDRPVFAFELAWDAIRERPIPRHHPVSRFPQVTRDLSFEFAESVEAFEVQSCIEKVGGELLRGTEVLDAYKEKDSKSTKKSMTFRLTLQSDYRNLTDEEVEAVARSVVAEIAANLGGELRGG